MPSSLDAAQKAIYQRIEAAWAALPAPRPPIAFPNQNFTPPRTGQPGYWLEVNVVWGGALPVSQGLPGGGKARNTAVGVIYLDVRGPRGEGRGALMGFANQVRDVFNRVEFTGVRCEVPSAPSAITEKEWERLQVTVPIRVDELV